MPEEINRVVTDHVSTRLFCPTETARSHLEHEGITAGVEVVGDVMCDILQLVRPQLAERAATLLASLGTSPHEYVLATVHRPVNTDDPAALERIVAALSDYESTVVFPLHPRTRKFLEQYGFALGSRIRLFEPAGYLDMLTLQRYARAIVTDSGGVQKEAFLLGTPCVTLRNETEWPETIAGGLNVLVGSGREALVAALHRPRPAPPSDHPFGAGDAAQRIAESLRVWP
jgi:UDP-N-acetylglucosamine 2-epimerase